MSADTLVPDGKNPQQFNRYAYGLNNPVKYTDPSGHFVVVGDEEDPYATRLDTDDPRYKDPNILLNPTNASWYYGVPVAMRVRGSELMHAEAPSLRIKATVGQIDNLKEALWKGAIEYKNLARREGQLNFLTPFIVRSARVNIPPEMAEGLGGAGKAAGYAGFIYSVGVAAAGYIMDRDASTLSDFANWLDKINTNDSAIELAVNVYEGHVTVSYPQCSKPFETDIIPGLWSSQFILDLAKKLGGQNAN